MSQLFFPNWTHLLVFAYAASIKDRGTRNTSVLDALAAGVPVVRPEAFLKSLNTDDLAYCVQWATLMH
ncbi:MAG: hypothetical protein R2813_05700 [Flavobacteriales bacterium]